MKFLHRVVALAAVALAAAGCGGAGGEKTHPVHGTVKFEDGAPLTTGEIFFESDQFSASGAIGRDGSFTLGSYTVDDGAPAGEYKVYITGAVEGGEYVPDGESSPVTPLVDAKFTSATTTPLTREVTRGQNNFNDIVVERP